MPRDHNTAATAATQTETESGRLYLRADDEMPENSSDLNNTERNNDNNTRRSVRFSDDVVDNEHMNKKKSKICCIFRKQRQFGESSSEESSSDSDSDLDSDSDNENDNNGCGHGHNHNHNHDHNERNDRPPSRDRLPSPNAYERQPKYKPSTSTPLSSAATS